MSIEKKAANSKHHPLPNLQENYCKIPRLATDSPEYAGQMSATQYRVYMYIIMNTIGYGDAFKRLSMNEIENGRKRKGGKLLCCGVNLTLQTITNCLNFLIYHGYIECRQNLADRGRIKSYYRPVMKRGPKLPDWWISLIQVVVKVDAQGHFIRCAPPSLGSKKLYAPPSLGSKAAPVDVVQAPVDVAQAPVDHRSNYLKNELNRINPRRSHAAEPLSDLMDGKNTFRKSTNEHVDSPAQSLRDEPPERLNLGNNRKGTTPAQSNGCGTSEDQKRVDHLRESLRLNRLPISSQINKTWVEAFRKLRRNRPSAEIDQTLQWFRLRATDKFTPRCWSATDFLDKYDAIREAMQKVPVPNLARYELEPKYQHLQNQIGSLGWPNGSGIDLPAAIQANLSHLEHVCKNLQKIIDNTQRYDNLAAAVDMSPEGLTVFWFETVHESVKDFKSWHGDLARHFFDPIRFGRLLEEQDSSLSTAWRRLLKDAGYAN